MNYYLRTTKEIVSEQTVLGRSMEDALKESKCYLDSTFTKNKSDWKKLADAFDKEKDRPKLAYAAFRKETVALHEALIWQVRQEKVNQGLYKSQHNPF